MVSFDTEIRVWYVDTDQMGIVHHSNYIKYYEEARSAFMRHLGVSYADMEAQGVLMPILKVESNYKRPARYDDVLTVRIIIKDIPICRFRMSVNLFIKAHSVVSIWSVAWIRRSIIFARKAKTLPEIPKI